MAKLCNYLNYGDKVNFNFDIFTIRLIYSQTNYNQANYKNGKYKDKWIIITISHFLGMWEIPQFLCDSLFTSSLSKDWVN